MEENNTNVQEVERPRTKKSTLKMGNDDHPELVSGQPMGEVLVAVSIMN